MTDKPQEYTVTCLMDFLKIPPEKLQVCLQDFAEWIKYLRERPDMQILGKSTFLWIDDGKVGLKYIDILSAGECIARLFPGGE